MTNTTIVAPQAVFDKLTNNETKTVMNISITGVPMYNLREKVTFHEKGRGNGYIIKLGNKMFTFQETLKILKKCVL